MQILEKRISLYLFEEGSQIIFVNWNHSRRLSEVNFGKIRVFIKLVEEDPQVYISKLNHKVDTVSLESSVGSYVNIFNTTTSAAQTINKAMKMAKCDSFLEKIPGG